MASDSHGQRTMQSVYSGLVKVILFGCPNRQQVVTTRVGGVPDVANDEGKMRNSTLEIWMRSQKREKSRLGSSFSEVLCTALQKLLRPIPQSVILTAAKTS